MAVGVAVVKADLVPEASAASCREARDGCPVATVTVAE